MFEIIKVNENTITVISENVTPDDKVLMFGFETIQEAEQTAKQRYSNYKLVNYWEV